MDFSLTKKVINYNSIKIEYPSHYTFIKEGADILCFAKMPETIGVLRISMGYFPNEDISLEVFNAEAASKPQGIPMVINNFHAWFFTEEKTHSYNDGMFWADETAPMSMYFYLLRVREILFMISYKLPAYMEDNGMFDSEHPTIMDIITSLTMNE